MTEQEFIDCVAELFRQYCITNNVRETSPWHLKVQYKDGKAVATQP